VLTGKADAVQVRCGAGRHRAGAVGCVGKVKSAPAPASRRAVPRASRRLPACGAECGRVRYCVSSCELAIRKPAPEWAGKAVVNDAIVDLSSSSLKGKWVVLFFYPLDFTFVCPTEIVEFNNKLLPPPPPPPCSQNGTRAANILNLLHAQTA
jgi:hypothetical protein